MRNNRFFSPALLGAILLLTLGITGCGKETKTPQPGKSGGIRLITVQPVLTETVYALGLDSLLVAVDTSSTFPEATARLPKVGYHRMLNAENLLKHSPTIVLASDQCGPKGTFDQLSAAGIAVGIYPAPKTVAEAAALIDSLAAKLNAVESGNKLKASLQADLAKADSIAKTSGKKPTILAVYTKGHGGEFSAIGKGTPAEALFAAAGATVVVDFDKTKPLSKEAAAALNPDYIVVPQSLVKHMGSEDAILKNELLGKMKAAKDKKIIVVEDVRLFGLGPGTGAAAVALARQLHTAPAAGK